MTTSTSRTTTTRTTTTRTTTRTEGLASNLAVLSFGGNVGDTEGHFHRALAILREHGSDLEVAPLYRSAPVSPIEQADYLNTVACLRSDLEAEDLLALTKGLELHAGRRPGARFGARPLDIDLLLFGMRTSRSPELELPHRALRARRFVLEPLAHLLPHLPLPPDGRTPLQLLGELEGDERVERIPWRRGL